MQTTGCRSTGGILRDVLFWLSIAWMLCSVYANLDASSSKERVKLLPSTKSPIWERGRVDGRIEESATPSGPAKMRLYRRDAMQEDCTNLIRWAVMRSEGWHKCAYVTDRGYRAVGAGFNLDDPEHSRDGIEGIVGVKFEDVYEGKSCLHDVEIDDLLRESINNAIEGLRMEGLQLSDSVCCTVQGAIVNIWFGLENGQSFGEAVGSKVIKDITSSEWSKAAAKVQESTWCKKNHYRCLFDAEKIESGCTSTVSG